ncbi:MAG: hypothetical protein AB1324_07980 [Candidatus Micrarchaeota archaeon]
MSSKLGMDKYKFHREKGQDNFSAVRYVRSYCARKFQETESIMKSHRVYA